MACALRLIWLFSIGWAAHSARLKLNVRKHQPKSTSDCSHLLKGNVSCVLGKRLGGGQQANTNMATINQVQCVLKETQSPDLVQSLNNERAKILHLQQKGFTQMPTYYLQFEAKQQGTQVLVMQLLSGWYDLNPKTIDAGIFLESGPAKDTAFTREVRVGAFFLALNALHLAGISHCDLNPGNAMFNLANPLEVKLIDFGLAEKNGVAGTCSYGGIPDKGQSGGAWDNIYATFVYGKGGQNMGEKLYSRTHTVTTHKGTGVATINSQCPTKPCNTETYWNAIIQQSQVLVNVYKEEYR